MAMAAQTRHAGDKRQWLLLADTWLQMIPERQRTVEADFDAAILSQRADQQPSTSGH
jgi:hypothetical protein